MNSLGVVNPMGVPAPVARALRMVPRAAWIFFGAAVLYVLAEVATTPSRDVPSAVWQAVVAGATTGLLIALPGIALVRMPDVRRVAPLAYVGLVLVSVGTVVRALAGGVLGRTIGVSADAAGAGDIVQTLLVASGWVVVALGWLALGRALGRRAGSAGVGVTAIAVVVVSAIGATVASALTSTLSAVADGSAYPGNLGLVVIGFGTYAATAFSWAALAWVFIRSLASDRSASMVAAGAWAVAVGIGAAFALAPDRVVDLSWLEANTDLWNAVGTVITMLPSVFLAIAVGLGLLGRPARRHEPGM